MTNKSESMKLAVISSYALPGKDGERIDRCIQQDGSVAWAVRRGAACMDELGLFVYEPMPSARDGEFFESCRSPSAEVAYEKWKHLVYDKRPKPA